MHSAYWDILREYLEQVTSQMGLMNFVELIEIQLQKNQTTQR